MPSGLNLSEPAPLSITSLVVNIVLCAILMVGVSWHFKRFGRTLSNRAELARILPFIALTTALIITVVKSSLALSLGLVGALSIVRFRTPIKEPEELAYLFIAIATGLGMGADQRIATMVAVPLILLMVTTLALRRRTDKSPNVYLNVELRDGEADHVSFQRLTDVLKSDTQAVDVRRFDVRDGTLQATFLIRCDGERELSRVMDRLRREFSGAAISFVDQSNVLVE